MQQAIDRLGGVQPLEDQYYSLREDEIKEIEQLVGGKLPAAYAWLLSTYGACLFVYTVQFVPTKQTPEYLHAEHTGIPNGHDFFGAEVGSFYGKNASTHAFTLRQKLHVFRDRMPAGFLPFADDGLGNQLCLGLGVASAPKVYWWNHELEWDADYYEAETGQQMPSEAKYQNVYVVADSFETFFKGLTVSTEA